MWPDRVWNPGPLTYESGALLTVLRGLATDCLQFAFDPFMGILVRVGKGSLTNR